MTEWIEHDGGECPVSPDTVVEMEFRDGDRAKGYPYGLRWNRTGTNGDIIRYRIVQEAPGIQPDSPNVDHYDYGTTGSLLFVREDGTMEVVDRGKYKLVPLASDEVVISCAPEYKGE